MVGKGLLMGLGAAFTVLGLVIAGAFYASANTSAWPQSTLVVLLIGFLFVICVLAVMLLFLKSAGLKISD